jgi:hypothetical protein
MDSIRMAFAKRRREGLAADAALSLRRAMGFVVLMLYLGRLVSARGFQAWKRQK